MEIEAVKIFEIRALRRGAFALPICQQPVEWRAIGRLLRGRHPGRAARDHDWHQHPAVLWPGARYMPQHALQIVVSQHHAAVACTRRARQCAAWTIWHAVQPNAAAGAVAAAIKFIGKIDGQCACTIKIVQRFSVQSTRDEIHTERRALIALKRFVGPQAALCDVVILIERELAGNLAVVVQARARQIHQKRVAHIRTELDECGRHGIGRGSLTQRGHPQLRLLAQFWERGGVQRQVGTGVVGNALGSTRVARRDGLAPHRRNIGGNAASRHVAKLLGSARHGEQ